MRPHATFNSNVFERMLALEGTGYKYTGQSQTPDIVPAVQLQFQNDHGHSVIVNVTAEAWEKVALAEKARIEEGMKALFAGPFHGMTSNEREAAILAVIEGKAIAHV